MRCQIVNILRIRNDLNLRSVYLSVTSQDTALRKCLELHRLSACLHAAATYDEDNKQSMIQPIVCSSGGSYDTRYRICQNDVAVTARK